MATRKHKNYSEDEVVRSLMRKRDIQFPRTTKTITINTTFPTGDIGIKSKGKIDFLVNHCGYRKEFI